MALSGFLLRHGLSEEETRLLVKTVAFIAGDEEANKRADAVGHQQRNFGKMFRLQGERHSLNFSIKKFFHGLPIGSTLNLQSAGGSVLHPRA